MASQDDKMEISVFDNQTQTELLTFIDNMMLDLGRQEFLNDASKIDSELDTEIKKQDEINLLWDEVDGLLDQYRHNLERQKNDLEEITKEQQQKKNEDDSIYTYSHYGNSSQGNTASEVKSVGEQPKDAKKTYDDSIYTYHYGDSNQDKDTYNYGDSNQDKTRSNSEDVDMETNKSPEPDLDDLIDYSATDENIVMETDSKPEETTQHPVILSKQPLTKGMKLLGKRRVDGIWYEGTFVGNITDQNGTQKYKIKYDGNNGKSLLSGKSIAFTTNPHPWEVKVGSRIVGIYLNEADSHDECFYAGIVAETPMRVNGYRYLIFFDDGFAQYMRINKLYKVYEQSENVWEDIHPDSREFIKEYLEIYPERPMVKVKAGQWIRTEWNGQWWKAKVLDVDGSLVNMLFEVDKRSEWIYRGSPRLETLFTELQHAEAARASDKGIAHVRSRSTMSKSKGPYVEYTRVREEPNTLPPPSVLSAMSSNGSSQRPTPSTANKPPISQTDVKHFKPKLAKKSTSTPFVIKQDTVKEKQTARKSTAAWKPQVFSQNSEQLSTSWEAPWMKRGQKNVNRSRGTYTHQKTDMASVLQSRLQQDTSDDSNDSHDINVLSMLAQIGRGERKKIFSPHNCSPRCVANCRQDPATLHGRNPFLKPELCGWRRLLGKQRGSGRRVVSYRTPCGRSLRTLEEVDRFLQETNILYLMIDEFTFDPFVHSHTNIRNPKPIMVIKDISEGKEPIPVSCVNEIDERYPIFVEYTTQRICARGVTVNTDTEFLAGCDCEDNCRDRTKCKCQQLTIQATAATNKAGIADPEAGYEHRLLYETIMTGIYECNPRCSCNHTCHNRVAQNGLQHRLQVFKTERRGWGLRCLDDIPVGNFVCTYAGELLTEELANEDGKRYGDEYLAELDLIEVTEARKEGYESDVRDPETSGMSDSNGSSSEDETKQHGLSTDSEMMTSSSQRTNHSSDSDSDFDKGSKTRTIEKPKHSKKSKAAQNNETKTTKSGQENSKDTITIKEDDTVYVFSSSTVAMETKSKEENQIKSANKKTPPPSPVDDDDCVLIEDVSMDTKPKQSGNVTTGVKSTEDKDVTIETGMSLNKNTPKETKTAETDVAMETDVIETKPAMQNRDISSNDVAMKTDTLQQDEVVAMVTDTSDVAMETNAAQKDSEDKKDASIDKEVKKQSSEQELLKETQESQDGNSDKPIFIHEKRTKPTNVSNDSKNTTDSAITTEKKTELRDDHKDDDDKSQDEVPQGLDIGDKAHLEDSLVEFFGGDSKHKGDSKQVVNKSEPCTTGDKNQVSSEQTNKKAEEDTTSGKPTNKKATKCLIDLTLDDDVIEQGKSSVTPPVSAKPFNVEQSPGRSAYGYNTNVTAKFVDQGTLDYIKASRAKRRSLKLQGDDATKTKTTEPQTDKGEENNSETENVNDESKKSVQESEKTGESEKNEECEKTTPSTRLLYGEEHCYVMDAKSIGNLGRYLNHSCTPNLFVQNVFVDTHDLRFPWVAFFAQQFIRAGSELTWDYNYEVGSVPGKVLQCYCGSTDCRGRLL